jgi:hypothetical protein
MYTLKQYRIKIESEAHSRLVQDQLFRLGYYWANKECSERFINKDKAYLFANTNGWIGHCLARSTYDMKTDACEMTLEQLKEVESIAELIIAELTSKVFKITGKLDYENAYFKGTVEVILPSFYVDLHLDCQQKVSKMQGESEVGLKDGFYIDTNEEIVINQAMIIVYDKTTSDPYTFLSEEMDDKIEQCLIARLRFEL